MEQVNSYYLPRWRSLVVGSILIVFGLAVSFISFDLHNSFWYNFQHIVISFESVPDFLVSLILLVFKLGFVIGGCIYIRFSHGIERARLDHKGFYYREIPKGGRLDKLGIDVGPLSFASYSAIKKIAYKKSFWNGGQLYLTLDSGLLPLPALGVLKESEKKDLVTKINAKISQNNKRG